MPVCCEVALPVPLDRTFTYAVRDGQIPLRGARVIVPFRNEKLIGVVTAVDVPEPAEFELRYLEAVLDDQPLLSEQLLALAEWTAQYYLAPLGEVLRAMLPLMAEVRRTVYYRITDQGRDVLAKALDGDTGSVLSHPFHEERDKDGAPEFVSRPVAGADSKKNLSREKMDAEHRVLARLAGGEPVKVSTLRTATRGFAAVACRIGAQEVDCARDRGRRARRTAHRAVRGAGA